MPIIIRHTPNGWLRALDANANRIREGLRVVEDIVRFSNNDSRTTEAIRELRHQVAKTFRSMNSEVKGWQVQRNSRQDVGNAFSNSSVPRTSLHDLLAANFKRVQESLRVFEELCSLHLPNYVASFHRFRFEAYRVETAVMAGFAKQFNAALYVVVDAASLGIRSPLRVAEETIRGGATMLQWRDTVYGAKASLRIAKQLHAISRKYQVPFIVNDRVEVAALSGAEGVHLGQQDLSIQDARRRLGDHVIIGSSNNTLGEAVKSAQAGADYISVGPVFNTTTKVPHRPLVPTRLLTQIVKKVTVPVIAIGGISPERIGDLMATGISGVAVSSAICLDRDVRGATRKSVRFIQKAMRLLNDTK